MCPMSASNSSTDKSNKNTNDRSAVTAGVTTPPLASGNNKNTNDRSDKGPARRPSLTTAAAVTGLLTSALGALYYVSKLDYGAACVEGSKWCLFVAAAATALAA